MNGMCMMVIYTIMQSPILGNRVKLLAVLSAKKAEEKPDIDI